MKALNVAEKPSVARQAASVLARQRAERRPSCSPYHPNWVWTGPFEFATVEGMQFTADEMVFTSVSGHVEETDFVPPYQQWSACEPADLFLRDQVPIRRFVPERNAKIVRNLQQLARSSQCLVLWLDGDAEGEAISDEVQRICRIPQAMVFRARFSAVTPRDLFRACSSLERLNQHVIAAVQIRQEIDLRAGAAFTRWLTRHIQQKYPQAQVAAPTHCIRDKHQPRYKGGDKSCGPAVPAPQANTEVISYGPCQFPTLGLVVDRYRERRQFQSKPFWTIQLRIELAANHSSAGSGHVDLSWDRGRIFDRFTAYALFQRVHDALSQPRTLRLATCEIQAASRSRPLPLSTVELQKQASRKLKLSSTQTMDIAEQLYQQGYISYPRTETDQFPTDGRGCVNLKSLIALQCEDQRWGTQARRLLETDDDAKGGFVAPRTGNRNDHAHPPIHPTKAAPPGTLSGDAARLYDYIARRFLASCSANAIGERTIWRFGIHSPGDGCHSSSGHNTGAILGNSFLETFTSRGLRITRLGYLDVFAPYEKWSETTLPSSLQPGATAPEQFRLTEMRLIESATEAPPLLSEADLIAAMDRHGIGTDATIAEHIKKIQERHYVTKQVIAGECSARQLSASRLETQDHDCEEAENVADYGSEVAATIANMISSTRTQRVAARNDGVARFVPMKLGIALVEAFERCQVYLARPNLRAEQEKRQRLVATGQATACDTLNYLLASFADAFRRLIGEHVHFDAAFGQFFQSGQHPVQAALPVAPAGAEARAGLAAVAAPPEAPPSSQSIRFQSHVPSQMIGPCAACRARNEQGVWIIYGSENDKASPTEISLDTHSTSASSAFWIRCSRYPTCQAQLCFSASVKRVQLIRNMLAAQADADAASCIRSRVRSCCASCRRSLMSVSWTVASSTTCTGPDLSSASGCVYGCDTDDGIVRAAAHIGWYPDWFLLSSRCGGSAVPRPPPPPPCPQIRFPGRG